MPGPLVPQALWLMRPRTCCCSETQMQNLTHCSPLQGWAAVDSAEEESSESDPEPDEAVTGYLGQGQEGGDSADFFREEGWSENEEVGS